MKINYYVTSFFWGVVAKLLNAIIGFLSVPLLLKYFGIENYGILGLATSTNGYMRLLDMGINGGSIKYFSQWRTEKKYELIDSVARTSISFYGIVGLINAVVLIAISIYGENIFNISYEQFIILRRLLYILAFFSVFNWISTVFIQLLISNNQISYTQKILGINSIVKLGLIFLTIKSGLSIDQYYFFLTFLSFLAIIPYYINSKKYNLISTYKPLFHWNDFSIVFKYSMALFVLGFFQMTAAQSRPLILGAFANDATKVVAQYKILGVFPMFIISIGGIFTSILLPKASQIIAKKNSVLKEKFAYEGTVYTTIINAFLTFPVSLCAKELLALYVGSEFIHLARWLVIWCFTLLISLPTTPCNSLILATGRTKEIVIITIISCISSIIFNILLSPSIGMGAAVLGYLFYTITNIGFNYIYNYRKVLCLEFKPLILAFFKPALMGGIAYAVVLYSNIEKIIIVGTERYEQFIPVIIKTLAWSALFILLLFAFNIINWEMIYKIQKK
jgi:O-antigen/teichoic acid export membrane protein